MEQNVGKAKADAWINAQVLRTRADRVTGSLDEELLEYAVPTDWVQNTDSHSVSLGIKAEADTVDTYVFNMDSMSASRGTATACASVRADTRGRPGGATSSREDTL